MSKAKTQQTVKKDESAKPETANDESAKPETANDESVSDESGSGESGSVLHAVYSVRSKSFRRVRAGLVFTDVEAQYQLTDEQAAVIEADSDLVVKKLSVAEIAETGTESDNNAQSE